MSRHDKVNDVLARLQGLGVRPSRQQDEDVLVESRSPRRRERRPERRRQREESRVVESHPSRSSRSQSQQRPSATASASAALLDHLVNLVESLTDQVDAMGAEMRALRRELQESRVSSRGVMAEDTGPRLEHGEDSIFEPDVQTVLETEIMSRGPRLMGESGSYRNDPVPRGPYTGREAPVEDLDFDRVPLKGGGSQNPQDFIMGEIMSSGPTIQIED
jgi:hypothetical protein